MAFQLTRLNVPNLTTDYSAETNAAAGLAKAVGGLPAEWRKQQEAATQKQILGSLGEDIKRGDYQSAASKAFALGDIQAGATISTLGQKAQSLEAQRGISTMLGGGYGGSPAPVASIGSPNEVENAFVGTVKQAGLTNPVGLGAVAAYGKAESGFSPANVNRTWSDPSESGKPGTSGGIMSWRGPRLEALNAFARERGEQAPTPQTQALFLAKEDPTLIPRLNAAKTPQEANQIMANAWRFAGYDRPGQGEYARREGLTTQYAQRFGQQPTQVAEAPQQPGGPVADMPAANAAPVTGPGTTQAAQAQGFAVPGTSLPPNDPLPHLTTPQLMGVISSPSASDGQRALAQRVLDNRQKYTDENAPDKREQSRLETQKRALEVQKLEREVTGLLTPEQEAQKARLAQAGRTQINNTNAFDAKGEGKFNEALGAAQAKRWNGYIEEGDVAQNRLADIQTLRETSRRLGSQGSSANLKATIGPYAESLGIKVDGLSDIQLYESITNRLAPTLRAPGSGSTSDIEFKGFMRAIGPLSNAPAAREMILDTFEAASRNDIARSEIASRLASGDINRQQAEKEIRALPNPLEGFRKFREANPDAVGQAIKETGQRAALEKNGPPKITSPEMASKLPSGTEFIDPNGIKRRVP